MRVQNVVGDQQPYDIATGLAQLLIDEGKVREFQSITNRIDPAKDLPAPNTTWGVFVFRYNNEPYIRVDCPRCKALNRQNSNGYRLGGPNVHLKPFKHCGIVEKVPEYIAEEYSALRSKFKPKAEQQTPEIGSKQLKQILSVF